MAFGRPSAIKLFVLVDRGNRELPIQPDYSAYSVDTDVKNEVKVILENTDEEEDKVILTV
jgi:pyrimidine operon attenuation protein / uracil phosphoribosyltransferase